MLPMPLSPLIRKPRSAPASRSSWTATSPSTPGSTPSGCPTAGGRRRPPRRRTLRTAARRSAARGRSWPPPPPTARFGWRGAGNPRLMGGGWGVGLPPTPSWWVGRGPTPPNLQPYCWQRLQHLTPQEELRMKVHQPELPSMQPTPHQANS